MKRTTRQQKHLSVPERKVPVAGDADVLVAGGGPAGIAAALAAARAGARTRLIETHGCLGGVWTAGLLAWMFEMDQPGIPREITQRLERRRARIVTDDNCYTYDIEEMKLLLEEMCAEAGVEFQLHTRVTGAIQWKGGIRAVLTESKSGCQAWTAVNFVDASGDGDLAALAGCAFDVGRQPSGECQPMTYMALITVPDAAAVGDCIHCFAGRAKPEWVPRRFQEELRRAGITPSYANSTLFQVRGNLLALMINHEYGISATDAAAITRATVSGRAEVNRVVRALGKLGGGWKGVQLVATCEQIGVREGRRIHGLTSVTQDDLAAGRHHEDAVCRVRFGVDVHCTNPKHGKGQEKPLAMKPYDIPMRALIARDVPNLLLAGRCLSGDFIAHSSYRVTGTAAASGQAAGAAAARSAQAGVPPARVPWAEVADALKRLGWRAPGDSDVENKEDML